MRTLSVLVGGILIGMGIQIAMSQSQNSGIVGVNHVGIAFDDLDAAVEYYTETLGYPEAFRIENDAGETALVYVQVSQGTFVELQPTNENRGPGINHFGVVVDDMDAAIAMWRDRGVEVQDGRAPAAPTRSSRMSSTPTATAWNCWNCRRSPSTPRPWRAGAGKTQRIAIGRAGDPVAPRNRIGVTMNRNS